MITPEYLRKVLEKMEIEASWLNVYLIKRIAKRMAASFHAMEENLIIPATMNDLHKLIDAGMVYTEVENVLSKVLPELEKPIRQSFKDSIGEIKAHTKEISEDIENALKRGDKDYKTMAQIAKDSGLSIPKVQSMEEQFQRSLADEIIKERDLSKGDKEAIDGAYKRTYGELHNYTHTTASAAQADYINACDEAFLKVKAGVSIDTAITEAIDSLATKGVSLVTYGGRRDSIETAIARAVRTGINQANAEVVLRKCSSLGVNYVLVPAHLGARVTKNNDYTNHAHWQGKVYQLDWNNKELAKYKQETDKKPFEGGTYPDFVKECGWGNILGICGINCRHTFQMFFPGINTVPDYNIDAAENEKRYKAEQKARSMERSIRQTKRRIEALKEAKTEGADAKIKELKGRLREQGDIYSAYCKNNNIKPSNSNIFIGKIKTMKTSGTKMAVYDDVVEFQNTGKWPPKGNVISIEQQKELKNYAKENGIQLNNIKNHDGDPRTIKDIIDDVKPITEKYPQLLEGKRALCIELDYGMPDVDYAETKGNIIHINGNAYRDINVLSKDYLEQLNNKQFVQNTTYHAIICHEVGHVFINRFLDGIINLDNIFEKVINKHGIMALQWANNNISKYAAVHKNEIIAECFACIFGGGEPSEEILRIIAECDKFIL